MGNMDQDMPMVSTETGKGYALSGKIMLSAIVLLFAVVAFIAGFHLYARWYLISLRRRQLERRRQRRRGGRTNIVLYADNQHRGSAMDRGLELAVLNTLPVFLHSSKVEPPPECAVCLSEFEENEVIRLLPRCNHSFHIECIDMWFHSHSTCPLCRSPVEPVVNQEKTVLIGITPPENANESEPGSSSLSEPRPTCQHEEGNGHVNTTSFRDRRKGLELAGVRIEVPARRTELEDELTPISTGFMSPGNRLLSLKRILSMSKKSPVSGGSGTTPPGVGSSCGRTDLDLESGLSELTQESNRVQTPRNEY